MSFNTSTIFLLLLFVTIISFIQSKKPDRTYIVRKDRIMSDYRLAELSFYDSSGKQLRYRIKNVHSDIHAIVLVAYPSKEIIGNLEGDWKTEIDKVSFSFLDNRSKQWIDGNITRSFYSLNAQYSISWNGTTIMMKEHYSSTHIEIWDVKPSNLLAKIRDTSGWLQRVTSKYKLDIFSNKVPDMIYFFALAIMDHAFMTNLEGDE